MPQGLTGLPRILHGKQEFNHNLPAIIIPHSPPAATFKEFLNQTVQRPPQKKKSIFDSSKGSSGAKGPLGLRPTVVAAVDQGESMLKSKKPAIGDHQRMMSPAKWAVHHQLLYNYIAPIFPTMAPDYPGVNRNSLVHHRVFKYLDLMQKEKDSGKRFNTEDKNRFGFYTDLSGKLSNGEVVEKFVDHAVALLVHTPSSGLHTDTVGLPDLKTPEDNSEAEYSAAWGLDLLLENKHPRAKYFAFVDPTTGANEHKIFMQWLKWKYKDDKRLDRLGTEEPGSSYLGGDFHTFVDMYFIDWVEDYKPWPFRGTSYIPHPTPAQHKYLQDLGGPKLHYHELPKGFGYFIPVGWPHATVVHGLHASLAWDDVKVPTDTAPHFPRSTLLVRPEDERRGKTPMWKGGLFN